MPFFQTSKIKKRTTKKLIAKKNEKKEVCLRFTILIDKQATQIFFFIPITRNWKFILFIYFLIVLTMKRLHF